MVSNIFEEAATNLGGHHHIDKMGLMKAYETVLRNSGKLNTHNLCRYTSRVRFKNIQSCVQNVQRMLSLKRK